MAFNDVYLNPGRGSFNDATEALTPAVHQYISLNQSETILDMIKPGYFPPYLGRDPSIVQIDDLIQIGSGASDNPNQGNSSLVFSIQNVNPLTIVQSNQYFTVSYLASYTGTGSGVASTQPLIFTRTPGGTVILNLGPTSYTVSNGGTASIFTFNLNLPQIFQPDYTLYGSSASLGVPFSTQSVNGNVGGLPVVTLFYRIGTTIKISFPVDIAIPANNSIPCWGNSITYKGFII